MSLSTSAVRVLHEGSEVLYDTFYNIRTRGYLLKSQIGVEHPDSNEYAATPYRVIRRLFKRLPSQCLQGSFVDYGCGCGRVAIMAACLPFRRVIGLEISSKLHAQAQENLQRSRAFRRAEVQFIEADAAKYPMPDDVHVAFFYKPFGGETMMNVLRRLERSIHRNPRELWILGYNASSLVDVATAHLSAEVVYRRRTIYPTIDLAALRVSNGRDLRSYEVS